MTGHIFACCIVANLILLTICNPVNNPKSRDRRQLYPNYVQDQGLLQEDLSLMKELWDQPVGLGFFVNPKGPADAEEATNGARRNLISDSAPAPTQDDGSGAGGPHEFKRDDIQKKPEAPVSNNKEEKLDGAVKSKVVEQSPEDPGDKKKVRSSVTCEGQKEWIQCDGPYELIKIKEAFWGRDDTTTCVKSDVARGLKTDKKCVQDGDIVLRKVREACDNENVCEAVASNIYFDQTDCGDVYKFLRLKWQCAPSESRIKE